MNIPDRFISQGIWWTVRYTDDIENLGETDYDRLEVLIKTSIPRDLQEAVFFHELHHTFNTTIDHSLMDSVAMQYFQIIKENNL